MTEERDIVQHSDWIWYCTMKLVRLNKIYLGETYCKVHIDERISNTTNTAMLKSLSKSEAFSNILVFVRWGLLAPHAALKLPPQLVMQYIRSYRSYLEAVTSICNLRAHHCVVRRNSVFNACSITHHPALFSFYTGPMDEKSWNSYFSSQSFLFSFRTALSS
jgi:hypothetical protein